jgi:XTP/dITP diphosphohydrolase
MTCPVSLKRVALDLLEIQSIDPVKRPTKCARSGLLHEGELVQDSALGITAWNGYPGALIKWVTQAVEKPAWG